MGDFNYSYDKLFGNKSQCEVCQNEKCSDRGKRSHYDGKKHFCSIFQEFSKERREEIEREKRKAEDDEEADIEDYMETLRKQFRIY